MQKILLLSCLLLGTVSVIQAQTRQVTGTVTDSSDGSAVPGVNVLAKGTAVGTATDNDGKFTIQVPSSSNTLVFSFVGYVTQEVSIDGISNVSVNLQPSSSELEEVVVSVGRGSQRTFTDTPLPVDNFTARDLATTGQFTFDKALQYRVPSFNTVNTPVNDATTLLDPYEVRNLGPSRTLILVNGKRKNLSSLLYVQFAPGRGETGADLSGIPTDAIKRVEILRDGASAQYGSDAIAGVMNVILKDKFEYNTLNVTSGVTSKGDGGAYGLSFNSGGNFAGKGFINYTIGFNQQNNAIRSGIIDVPTEIATFGDPSVSNSVAPNAQIVSYLNRFPTANNLNGTGETSAAKFLYNFGIPFGENGQVYSNAAFVVKKVISNANFRTPYWRIDHGLLHTPIPGAPDYTTGAGAPGSPIQNEYLADQAAGVYQGYLGYMPTFEGDLTDYNATLGAKNETNGWVHDVSLTVGGNTQLYTVNNTVNRGLRKASPTSFKPGGFNFNHIVGNIDISKAITRTFNFAIGAEARRETYTIIAGDTASYTGQGANSFPGIRAENARTNSRYNLGGYVDASWDITDNWLVQGTIRGERYSDFGDATVGKISTRYKIAEDKFVLRGSVSSGFRAPTLHQIYAQSTQASFAGGTIVQSGLFNNNSKEAFLLGIPKLKAEKSVNLAFGFGLTPSKNFSLTVDYYDITISDRIVYSSSITTPDATSTLGRILTAGDLTSVQFFINGIKTKTNGLDVVANYRNIDLGPGKLAINVAGNYVLTNEIVGSPNDPDIIKSAGATILNAQVKSLLTEGRPQYKFIGGFDYSINKFNVVLNNTLFGPTKFQDLDNGGSVMNNIKQVFSPAVVSDLNIGYAFSKNISASFTVNNLFNVLPKWKLELTGNPSDPDYADAVSKLSSASEKSLLEGFLTFSGRYRILGYNGSQFSQLGTTFMGQLTFKF
ncbi:MAG: TonB-dependent receptor [Cyclobacteriaceae bacterium]|nr:TonB-dependent receptor [Cyclobacteriaceae bacterium]